MPEQFVDAVLIEPTVHQSVGCVEDLEDRRAGNAWLHDFRELLMIAS